jgi:hypothetical protein
MGAAAERLVSTVVVPQVCGAAETDAAALDTALIALHGCGEAARLSALHRRAAEHFRDDAGARRFHLTHGWVYALEAGDEGVVAGLEAELRALGGL